MKLCVLLTCLILSPLSVIALKMLVTPDMMLLAVTFIYTGEVVSGGWS